MSYTERCQVVAHLAPKPIISEDDVTPLQLSLTYEPEWRPIEGFPDYEVREDGTIRRTTASSGIIPRPAGMIRKHCLDKRSGYKYLILTAPDGRKYRKSVHGIVATAFWGPKPTPKHEVAHGDRDRGNNHYLNLRWDTHEGNLADMVEHGTHHRGERHWNAKLTAAEAADVKRRALAGEKVTDLAREYGVAQVTTSRIKLGKRWGNIA